MCPRSRRGKQIMRGALRVEACPAVIAVISLLTTPVLTTHAERVRSEKIPETWEGKLAHRDLDMFRAVSPWRTHPEQPWRAPLWNRPSPAHMTCRKYPRRAAKAPCA